jgi:hypothetical protein
MSRDVSTVDGGAPEFSVRAAGSFFQHPADGLNAYQNILYNLDHMIVSTFLLFFNFVAEILCRLVFEFGFSQAARFILMKYQRPING